LEIANQVMESFPVCFFREYETDPLFLVVLNSSKSSRKFRLELEVVRQFKLKDCLVHFVEQLQVHYWRQIKLILHQVLVHEGKVLQFSDEPRVSPTKGLNTLILWYYNPHVL